MRINRHNKNFKLKNLRTGSQQHSSIANNALSANNSLAKINVQRNANSNSVVNIGENEYGQYDSS